MNYPTPCSATRELSDITKKKIFTEAGAAGELHSTPADEVSILVNLRREKYASWKQPSGFVVYECCAGGAHSGQRHGSATRRPRPRKTRESRGTGVRPRTPRLSQLG